jgi:hypothetical protein
MPKKGAILTPEQRAKKKVSDKKYNEANKDKRKEWARAQYLKDKGNGMRQSNGRRVWGHQVLVKKNDLFTLTFD